MYNFQKKNSLSFKGLFIDTSMGMAYILRRLFKFWALNFSALASYSCVICQYVLKILLFTPLTSERKRNTSLMGLFGSIQSRQSCSLMTVSIESFVYVSLFYSYYNWFCSNNISGIISENHVFLRTTRLSWRGYTYVIDWPLNLTIPYKLNPFL